MSATLERTTVTVNMERDCLDGGCVELAERTHAQLASGAYTWPCSLLPLPASVGEWEAEHRTARKRAWAAERAGYRFREFCRSEHADDIYAINTSAPERQGRPMSTGYLVRQQFSPLPAYPCERHAIRSYGVFDAADVLRAYTVVHRVGALVMFSQILGHADHLERHVMYLLVRGALAAQAHAGPGFAFYNRADSGTDGLRFFKERCGFTATRIDWRLA